MSVRAAALLLPLVVVFNPCGALAQAKPQGTVSGSPVSKFVGTWKEDLSKRQGELQGLTFRRSGNGGLEELRGSELKPLVQPVNFTGKPYAIDGSANTIAWKQIDQNRFERGLYTSGRLLNTRRLQLSVDGQSLTQETEAIGPSGQKIVNTIVFRRASGDKGLAGVWKPQSSKVSSPPEVTYEVVGGDRIKVTTTGANPTMVTAPLNNTAVPVVGDAVISGTMTAVRLVDASTLEFTNSREGTVTGKSVRTVSADGKLMTVTNTQLGPNASKEPQISVFVRQ